MRYTIHILLKYQLLCIVLSPWDLCSAQIRYSIPEELQLGAFVGNVAADLGLDVKQLAARGVRVASGPSRQYVAINLQNGNLLVNSKIDREELCGPIFDCVLALDLVLENPLILYQVEVEIVDINDNAPIFQKNQIRLEISEIVATGTRFTLDSAHDPDIGTNSLQTYQLLPNEYFSLDIQMRSGKGMLPVLVLQKPLDREVISNHKLTVIAKDGGTPVRSGIVQVKVTVKDVNDNAPVFPQSVYRVTLLESAPPGTLIIRLNATDLDDGPNGEVTYSFSSHSSTIVREAFEVDSKTGEIRVRGVLDYEENSVFEINVQAMDMGSGAIPEHCDVLVNIIDVNDNPPEVALRSLSSAIPEDTPVGTIVALFTAADKDSGQNGQVQCHISDQLPFKLDSSKKNYYKLLTDHVLDRENTSWYDITILCTDAGNPSLTFERAIRVEVSDINDNAPRFTQPVYTARIKENNIIGASMFSAIALDPDVGHNARLHFSLAPTHFQSTPISEFVSINSQTGEIFAQRSFDYEQIKDFQVQVHVRDSGVPPLSSNVSLHFVIIDQNDNAPVIVNPLPEYGSIATETISRYAEPGYLVLKISATDADAGENGHLSYQILQAASPNLFTISTHTGEIWTIRSMARTDASKQRLNVVVADNGIPSLSASLTLLLNVVDSRSETFSSVTSLSHYTGLTPDLTLSLVIALGIISAIFLMILIILASILHKDRSGLRNQHCFPGVCCCWETRQSLNGIKKASRSLQIPPNYVEVFGGDPLSQSFRYESCSTLQSAKRDFITANTCKSSSGNNRVQNEYIGDDNTRVINTDNYSKAVTEVKQPNADWHFSQTHRAELNSAQYLEEEGARREIQCEVQREVHRDVQREALRDEPCEVPRNIQRDVPRDPHCDGQRDPHCNGQRAAENDPGGPRKPMCARPPAIPAGRDGWTLPRTAPRMQLQMTLGTHVPGTLRSQYLFPRDPLTPGARISNSSVEFSAFPVGSHHGPWAANQTRDRGSVTDSGTRRPELDTETGGEIHRSPPSSRLPTQRLHSRDHNHALRQIND
ncbi:protocadherin gamma-C5-like isoform X4 [Rhinoraja longicauda]